MILAIALAASTTGAVQVDVGKWNPADFPGLIKMERRMPHGEMTRRVEKLFDKGSCRIAGQTKRRFDITVPYAVLMEGGGALKKVVVGEVGCPSLETLVGQVVVAQAGRGDFKPEHASGARWYTSELTFSKTEQQFSDADKDKVICKADQPLLGTRLKVVRTCKTAADWQAFENDREQLRRDLGNMGRHPGDG